MPLTQFDTPTPGKELRGIRLQLGMNITAFGRLLGCSRGTVHRYENGTRTPHPPVLTLARWAIHVQEAMPDGDPTPSYRRRKRQRTLPAPLLYVPPDPQTPVFVLFGPPVPGHGCAWAKEGRCEGEVWRLVLLLEPNRDPEDATVCQAHFWPAYVKLQEVVKTHWKRLKDRQRRKEARIRKQQEQKVGRA